MPSQIKYTSTPLNSSKSINNRSRLYGNRKPQVELVKMVDGPRKSNYLSVSDLIDENSLKYSSMIKVKAGFISNFFKGHQEVSYQPTVRKESMSSYRPYDSNIMMNTPQILDYRDRPMSSESNIHNVHNNNNDYILSNKQSILGNVLLCYHPI